MILPGNLALLASAKQDGWNRLAWVHPLYCLHSQGSTEALLQ